MRLALVLLGALACNRTASVAAADVEVPSAVVVDDATASSCTVAYMCGLSHPGLGSSSRVTSIDLATCTRTTSSESGPYENDRPAPPPSAAAHKPAPVALSSSDCARVKTALTAVTQADARAGQESAKMDTEACSLALQCKGEPAPRMNVQRQTMTGPSPVEALIRAVLGVAP